MTPENRRLKDAQEQTSHWKKWGPYLSERQREAKTLPVVGDSGQPVFAPAVGPGTGRISKMPDA